MLLKRLGYKSRPKNVSKQDGHNQSIQRLTRKVDQIPEPTISLKQSFYNRCDASLKVPERKQLDTEKNMTFFQDE